MCVKEAGKEKKKEGRKERRKKEKRMKMRMKKGKGRGRKEGGGMREVRKEGKKRKREGKKKEREGRSYQLHLISSTEMVFETLRNMVSYCLLLGTVSLPRSPQKY